MAGETDKCFHWKKGSWYGWAQMWEDQMASTSPGRAPVRLFLLIERHNEINGYQVSPPQSQISDPTDQGLKILRANCLLRTCVDCAVIPSATPSHSAQFC